MRAGGLNGHYIVENYISDESCAMVCTKLLFWAVEIHLRFSSADLVLVHLLGRGA